MSGDVRGQVTDISYKDVRGAFEAEHLHNKVDACNAYALSVFPFGREDEWPEDWESEDWETGMYGSTGSPRADWLPALRRVDDGRIGGAVQTLSNR